MMKQKAVAGRKLKRNTEGHEYINNMTKDNSEITSVKSPEGLTNPTILKEFLKDARTINVRSSNDVIQVLSKTTLMEGSGPYLECCSSVTNMFLSPELLSKIAENISFETGKWYLNVRAYPPTESARKSGFSKILLCEPKDDMIRVVFAIPFLQSNEELTIVNRSSVVDDIINFKALELAGTYFKLIPPSLARSYELSVSTKTNRYITRTSGSFIAVFTLSYVQGAPDIRGILGVETTQMPPILKLTTNGESDGSVIVSRDGRTMKRQVAKSEDNSEERQVFAIETETESVTITEAPRVPEESEFAISEEDAKIEAVANGTLDSFAIPEEMPAVIAETTVEEESLFEITE